MSTTEPFNPQAAATLACTATSASTAINANHPQVLLTNLGTNKVFFRMGVGAQTAVTTDTMLVSGQSRVFSKGLNDTLAAVCAATETATLSVTTGFGS